MNDSKKGAVCQTPNVFCVYVIWCRLTEKFYVGVTYQKVAVRIRQHRRDKQFVDREIQRIGWENFDWWVVDKDISADEIDEREKYWVEFFDSVYPKGYNRTHGGIGHISVTAETREKISKSHLGKTPPPFSAEHRANLSKSKSGENNPNYGKPAWNRSIPCSEESKSKISKTLTGRKRPDQSERMKGEKHPMYGKHLSAETKKKLSDSKRGKTPCNKGIPHTEEAKAKMRGRKVSEETREKNRQAQLGKKHTEEWKAEASVRMSGENNPFFGKHHTKETKEKISRANSGRPSARKGKKHTEESKAKMRAAALAREAAKRAAKEAEKKSTRKTPTESFAIKKYFGEGRQPRPSFFFIFS